MAAIDGCLNAAGQPSVAAVAISNQRESAVAWERATGERSAARKLAVPP